MKHRNYVLTATLFALAFAFAPVVQAGPYPDGGPTRVPSPTNAKASNEASSVDSISIQDAQMPVITINSVDNVTRGKTGTFVLNMNPVIMLGGMYVNFSVSGTAIPGVDYVALLSPAYIGQSGYGIIQVQTLRDPRASSLRQAYSVEVTLEAGPGYAVGKPSSATMWIKP